jgi:hypothetical protein
MVMERGKRTRTFIFVSLDAAGLSLDNYNEWPNLFHLACRHRHYSDEIAWL